MSHDRVEQGLRIGVVLVIAFAFVHVVESFSFTPYPQFAMAPSLESDAPTVRVGVESRTVDVRSVHCGPALFDAWHAKSPPSGWFAYAPLTNVSGGMYGSCRQASQHRIRRAGLGLLIGLAVLLSIWMIDRRRGFDPGPTAEPAT
jgi:hypothetical protein